MCSATKFSTERSFNDLQQNYLMQDKRKTRTHVMFFKHSSLTQRLSRAQELVLFLSLSSYSKLYESALKSFEIVFQGKATLKWPGLRSMEPCGLVTLNFCAIYAYFLRLHYNKVLKMPLRWIEIGIKRVPKDREGTPSQK